MQITAKKVEGYVIKSVVCDERDVDPFQLFARAAQMKHLAAHAAEGTKCESVPPLPDVLVIDGPSGCIALDTVSLNIAVAAYTNDMPLDVYALDVGEFEAMVKAGGDYRKDIIMDGQRLCDKLDLSTEGEPQVFDEGLRLIREPAE